METQNQNPPARATSRGFLSQGAMWASAFVLAGLTLMQTQRFGTPSAHGTDIVSNVGGDTALTFETQNEDLVAVIDGRQEALFVYHIVNKNTLEQLASYNLSQTFADARNRAAGGRVR